MGSTVSIQPHAVKLEGVFVYKVVTYKIVKMGFDKVGQILMQIITVGDRCML